MRVGIGSWTFPWAIGVRRFPSPPHPLNAQGLLAKAVELGVQVVQIANNLPLHTLDVADLEGLRSTARKHAITLEVGTRGMEPSRLVQYLEIAERLESKLVRTVVHADDSTPDITQAEEWLREVLPLFSARQIAIAIENHERHKARDLARLVERVGSPYVGICLDTVNSMGALESPAEVVRVLAPYVLNLHIKDFEMTRIESDMGFSIAGRPAGGGCLDIAWIVEELLKCGRTPNMILELWTPFCGSLAGTIALEDEWARQSIRFLRRCEPVGMAAVRQ
jgi:sugar phosphate isomerase/epimerase